MKKKKKMGSDLLCDHQLQFVLSKLRGEDQVRGMFVCKAWQQASVEAARCRRDQFTQTILQSRDLLGAYYSDRITGNAIMDSIQFISDDRDVPMYLKMVLCSGKFINRAWYEILWKLLYRYGVYSFSGHIPLAMAADVRQVLMREALRTGNWQLADQILQSFPNAGNDHYFHYDDFGAAVESGSIEAAKWADAKYLKNDYFVQNAVCRSYMDVMNLVINAALSLSMDMVDFIVGNIIPEQANNAYSQIIQRVGHECELCHYNSAAVPDFVKWLKRVDFMKRLLERIGRDYAVRDGELLLVIFKVGSADLLNCARNLLGKDLVDSFAVNYIDKGCVLGYANYDMRQMMQEEYGLKISDEQLLDAALTKDNITCIVQIVKGRHEPLTAEMTSMLANRGAKCILTYEMDRMKRGSSQVINAIQCLLDFGVLPENLFENMFYNEMYATIIDRMHSVTHYQWMNIILPGEEPSKFWEETSSTNIDRFRFVMQTSSEKMSWNSLFALSITGSQSGHPEVSREACVRLDLIGDRTNRDMAILEMGRAIGLESHRTYAERVEQIKEFFSACNFRPEEYAIAAKNVQQCISHYELALENDKSGQPHREYLPDLIPPNLTDTERKTYIAEERARHWHSIFNDAVRHIETYKPLRSVLEEIGAFPPHPT